MSVMVTYECDECFVKSEPVRLSSEFISISGRSYGFGTRHYDKPQDKAPEGWIAYDHIGCTYCPKCAEELS